jgi:hypothetical protein
LLPAIADDAGLQAQQTPTVFGGTAGAMFLNEVEDDAGEDDRIDKQSWFCLR